MLGDKHCLLACCVAKPGAVIWIEYMILIRNNMAGRMSWKSFSFTQRGEKKSVFCEDIPTHRQQILEYNGMVLLESEKAVLDKQQGKENGRKHIHAFQYVQISCRCHCLTMLFYWTIVITMIKFWSSIIWMFATASMHFTCIILPKADSNLHCRYYCFNIIDEKALYQPSKYSPLLRE